MKIEKERVIKLKSFTWKKKKKGSPGKQPLKPPKITSYRVGLHGGVSKPPLQKIGNGTKTTGLVMACKASPVRHRECHTAMYAVKARGCGSGPTCSPC